MPLRTSARGLASVAAVLLLAASARAGGLYVAFDGSPTLGTSTAGVNALAEDASTAYWNPAGMTRIEGHRFMGSLAPGFTTIEFDVDQNPAGGGDGGEQGGLVPISSGHYVHALSERWRLGLALFSLAGAGLDPNNGWAGRNQLTEVTVFNVTVAPTVAVKVCDWLSLGGGMTISYGRLDLKLRLPLQNLGEPPLKVTGMDDWAVAPVASFLVEPRDDLRFGVLYQGETKFQLEGYGRLKGRKSKLVLDLPFAQAVRASLVYEPTERLTLLASGGWEDWSTAKTLPLSAPGGSAQVPLDLRDTWYAAGGVQFALNDRWTLQTGLRYDSSALKDSDRLTSFPFDRAFTTSFGAIQRWSDDLRLAYGFTWVDLGKAPVNKAVIKGDYRQNALYVFAVSLEWKQLPWAGWGTL